MTKARPKLTIANQAQIAQNPAPPSSPAPPARPAPPPTRPLLAPLFLQDQDFSSKLVLVNASGLSTYADVILRAPDGSQIAQQRVTFAPHSQQQVDVGALLASVASSAPNGSILVLPDASLHGPAIQASLSISYAGSSQLSSLDEDLTTLGGGGSHALRAVADSGDGSPILAFASLGASVQHVTIGCIGGNGLKFSKSVVIQPGGMLLTGACSDSEIPDPVLHSPSANTTGNSTEAVGLSLSSDGAPGSFAAFALVPHHRRDQTFFSSVAFTDPANLMSANTVFAGVPVGPATLLPSGNYTAKVSLVNFSSRDAQVGIQFSNTSSNTPSTQAVKTLTIHGQSSQEITLPGMQGDSELRNSFLLTSDGAPGDVVAKLSSTSDSGVPEVEVLGEDEQALTNGGAYLWSLESGSQSSLLLFNHSQDPQAFTVRIMAGAGVWEKRYSAQSMETKAVSIGDVIQQQEKDDRGKLLPADATSGTIEW